MIAISKTTQKQIITAIKSGDFSEANKIRVTAKNDAIQAFNAVSSGSVRVAWYDKPPVITQSGAVSVMRYALHRSTKKEGYLQLSYMEIKDNCIIPTGDIQFDMNGGFRDFFRELPNNVVINF